MSLETAEGRIRAQIALNERRAEIVDAVLSEAEALGIDDRHITRRQGRKMLQGRGGLMQRLREARKAKEVAAGR